jgi:aryl-alcohol dehydrogenase-like predicted oxidoreductase
LARVYQVHSATPESGVLDDAPVVADLAALRADGLAVGVTVSGTSQGQTLAPALELGLFDVVQATWNLHERAAEPELVRTHARGVRVYVKEALANGRLAGREPAPALEAAARAAGTTPDALALAAVLARPWADVVLSGAATVDTLCSNLRATAVAWTPELDCRLAVLGRAVGRGGRDPGRPLRPGPLPHGRGPRLAAGRARLEPRHAAGRCWCSRTASSAARSRRTGSTS